MSELLNRFSFDAVKFNTQLLICLLLLWAAVVGCAVHSIRSQPFNRQQRWFWILLVVCLPGVGVLAYLPFSQSKERPSNYLRHRGRK